MLLRVDPCKLFYLEILLVASAVPVDGIVFVITLSYILAHSSNNGNSKETARWLLRKSYEVFIYKLSAVQVDSELLFP